MASEIEETETALLDIQALVESLTGFDQIAIRQRFNERFETLAEDQIMLVRAMYFVQQRRDGAKDADAFQQAMTLPFGELKAMFMSEEDGAPDPDDESAIAERDREFAEFVMGTGLSYTVEQFMALTLTQRAAVYDVAAKTRR